MVTVLYRTTVTCCILARAECSCSRTCACACVRVRVDGTVLVHRAVLCCTGLYCVVLCYTSLALYCTLLNTELYHSLYRIHCTALTVLHGRTRRSGRNIHLPHTNTVTASRLATNILVFVQQHTLDTTLSHSLAHHSIRSYGHTNR